jgi:hypothetical protein
MAKQGKKTQGKKTQGKKQGRTAYKGGLYAIGEAFIRGACKGIVTRSALVAHLVKTITAERKTVTEVPARLIKRYKTLAAYQGIEAVTSAASATATVLLSPRAVGDDQSKAKKGQILSGSGRGDCRGNFSAMGHLYFMAPLARKADKDGVKPEQRYRWGWRKEAVAAHSRPVTVTANQEVKASKTAKKAVKKTVAKKTVKAVAKKAVAKKATKKKATKKAVAKKTAPAAPAAKVEAKVEATA